MNILWDSSNTENFWLYVGQAVDLSRRIADHCDKAYRRKHPSLYYHVWDSNQDMESQFVILACMDLDTPLSRTDQCLLNLQEMWMACVFRTLTGRDLDKYLSPSVGKQSSGRHLNVAPPIWQRFTDEEPPNPREVYDREKFLDLLHSETPETKHWAECVRDSYNDLRNSPDPRLREYWFHNNKEQLRHAGEATEREYHENMKIYQEYGKEEIVRCAPGRNRGYINCGKYSFAVPQSLEIPAGSKVTVQFHLYETPVPYMYAQKAMPDDPSSRLAISIKSGNSADHQVHSWLQSARGEKIVMKMNTLVDALEGVSYSVTQQLRRRWRINRTGQVRVTSYKP